MLYFQKYVFLQGQRSICLLCYIYWVVIYIGFITLVDCAVLCELAENLFWESGLHIYPPLPFQTQACLSQTFPLSVDELHPSHQKGGALQREYSKEPKSKNTASLKTDRSYSISRCTVAYPTEVPAVGKRSQSSVVERKLITRSSSWLRFPISIAGICWTNVLRTRFWWCSYSILLFVLLLESSTKKRFWFAFP